MKKVFVIIVCALYGLICAALGAGITYNYMKIENKAEVQWVPGFGDRG